VVKIKRYVIETTYINDYGEKLVLVEIVESKPAFFNYIVFI